MPEIKELLKKDELEKIAALLKEKAEELARLSFEEVRELLQKQSDSNEASEYADLIKKVLDPNEMDEATWGDSLDSLKNIELTERPTVGIVQTGADDSSFTLITTKGKTQLERDAIAKELDAEYTRITTRDPEVISVTKEDDIPKKFQHLFDQKKFSVPVKITIYKFESTQQLEEFKEKLEALKKDGKINYSDATAEDQKAEERYSSPSPLSTSPKLF